MKIEVYVENPKSIKFELSKIYKVSDDKEFLKIQGVDDFIELYFYKLNKENKKKERGKVKWFEEPMLNIQFLLNEISREYWIMHLENKYLKGTLIPKEKFPCYGYYEGNEKCNNCEMWLRCAKEI